MSVEKSILEKELYRYNKPSSKRIVLVMLIPAAVLSIGFFLFLPFFNMMAADNRETIELQEVSLYEVKELSKPDLIKPLPKPEKPKETKKEFVHELKPKLQEPKQEQAKKPEMTMPEFKMNMSFNFESNMTFTVSNNNVIPENTGPVKNDNDGGDKPVKVIPKETENENKIFKTVEVDTNPKLIHMIEPKAVRTSFNSEAIFTFTVTKNGDVTDIKLERSMRAASYIKMLRNALAQWKFEPGIKNGKKVAVRMQQKFILKRNR